MCVIKASSQTINRFECGLIVRLFWAKFAFIHNVIQLYISTVNSCKPTIHDVSIRFYNALSNVAPRMTLNFACCQCAPRARTVNQPNYVIGGISLTILQIGHCVVCIITDIKPMCKNMYLYNSFGLGGIIKCQESPSLVRFLFLSG